MPRLRIRIELNRRVSGVPLEKMVSVVEETRKFFYLLSEDVHVESGRGEWVASDFDAESLNFTAEFVGPVTAEQVHAFGSAFAGATSLRRTTIAQFTRIADFLGEDELVGFGLFQHDQETEPSEWRCLSKRDAMRFGEEIKLLAEAAGEQLPETQLPAVNGAVAGRRLFKDRRERQALAADPSKLVRELESNLSRRISLLEGEMAEQTRKMQQIGGDPGATEERFQRLLTAIEMFWAQAPQHFPQLPAAPSTPAAAPQKQRGASVSSIILAAIIAILSGLALPEMHHQWSRFASVEPLPLEMPKPPAAPDLPETPVTQKTALQRRSPPVIKTVAARSLEPFIGPLIPLDIPDNIRAKIQSEVRVNVLIAIDQAGNVTSARIASMKGERAHLLVAEALRAARESRFRPAREGEQTVQSKMVLTFLFKPGSDEF